MIKVYLTCIPSYYEGEDIEIRYVIYKDGELTEKKSVFTDYCKPVFCGLVSMEKILDILDNNINEEIVLVINDGGLYELLNGVSMTNKRDVLRKADKIRDRLDKFSNIEIENVSADHLEIEKWDEILTRD